MAQGQAGALLLRQAQASCRQLAHLGVVQYVPYPRTSSWYALARRWRAQGFIPILFRLAMVYKDKILFVLAPTLGMRLCTLACGVFWHVCHHLA